MENIKTATIEELLVRSFEMGYDRGVGKVSAEQTDVVIKEMIGEIERRIQLSKRNAIAYINEQQNAAERVANLIKKQQDDNRRIEVATQLLAGILACPTDFREVENAKPGEKLARRVDSAIAHADALIARVQSQTQQQS